MPKPLSTNLSLTDFGKAMSQIDLSNVPEHHHKRAVKDHLLRIQQDTITDQKLANEIAFARIYANKLISHE